MDLDQNDVDSSGTGQAEARDMLRAFCQNGFEGDENRAAVALGRPGSEIREMLDGQTAIDDDLAAKVRGIARERDFRVD
jgi:plasmid maintenance system antidote protein VapI